MHQLLPFIVFAFVASITPGPTNLLAMSNSACFGLLATLPLVAGACVSAATVVLLVGLGLGEALLQNPLAQTAMAWFGAAWITWLAWQLFRAASPELAASQAIKKVGVLGGAGLQWVNPKNWVMALAVVSVFAGAGAGWQGYGLYALIFLLIALPCMTAWAWLGHGAARVLKSPDALRRFNQGMALLLAGSTWLALLG